MEEFSSSSRSTCLVLSSGFVNVTGAGMKKALKKKKKMIVIITIIIIIRFFLWYEKNVPLLDVQ